MSTPKTKTIKRLFAKSKNQCAFPNCYNQIIDNDTGKVLGEICHIKAQKPNGPRYDNNQPDDNRHEFENLILLCSVHHKIIDSDIESYSIERLYKMKEDHESKSEEFKSTIDSKKVDELIQNIYTSNTIILESNQLKQINPKGGQYAQTIQNFNTPIKLDENISYDELLGKIYDESLRLSQILAETIKIANAKNDEQLIDLCKTELSGWIKDDLPNYRTVVVFISTAQIKSVNNISIDQMWNDLESSDKFVKKEMFFPNAVPLLETSVDEGKHLDPHKSFIHLNQKQGGLFPGLPNPEIVVHIYARGTLYLGLLKSIRNNLASEILKRIK